MADKNFTELLAPAKDKETAFAAIDCGADAVYIGAGAFGARQNASNSLEDIKEVIDYAHKFWAKVFITVNTILNDSELEQAVELVKELDKIGADAILVQDMGLLKRIGEDESITVPIHISTQCDNREVDKVSFFNKLGVSRVVLARELSLEQIKEIHKANPNLELECFVHGALCVSYSGQCYLSQYIGGRSANRGECAQPCRKKYSVLTDDGQVIAKDIYPLCMKDFNASKNIKSLIDSGAFSFTIEGRLKDAGYVKNITSYYRQELDKYSQKVSSGKSIYPFSPNPEKSFNRGFTDYFLEKRKDCYNFISPKSRGEFVGTVEKVFDNKIRITSKSEIHPQDGLCFETENGLNGFLVNKVEGNIVYPNQKIEIKSGTKIYRNQDVEFEKELSKKVRRCVGISVSLENYNLSIVDEDGVETNFKIPSGEKAKNHEKMKETFVTQFSKTGESDFYIEDFKINSELPFLPISEINQFRRDCFSAHIKERINKYLQNRDRKKPVNPCEFYKKELDYRANIHNKTAIEFYKECGVEGIKEMSLETKLPARQVELMRTKHCIKFALGMCKSPKNLLLQDEKGVKYPLFFDCKNCEMAVLSPNN